jgi:endoglucanase
MISTGYIKKASLNKTKWSLNPSYYPLPLLRRIAFERSNLQWDEIISNVPKVIKEGSPQKFPADWIYYKLNTGDIPEFYFDPTRGQKSSFDAIRVYLWAGVTHPDDPYRRDILLSISGIVRAIAIKGYVPEKIDALTGEIINNSYSPFGFSAAVAPYFYAIGKKETAQAQINRANSMIKKSQLPENINTNKLRYYDYSLSLFGLGFTEGYYRFNLNGFLETAWMHKNCAKFDLSY